MGGFNKGGFAGSSGAANPLITPSQGLIVASHITTTGTAPGVSAQAALGNATGLALAAGSTDEAGTVSFTAGTTTTAGNLLAILYAVLYAGSTKGTVITPQTQAAAVANGYVFANNNNALGIACAVAPVPGSVYSWSYIVIG